MADASNHKKYIMTVAQDSQLQCATTRRKTLPYHEHEGKGGPIQARNCIETWKCSIEESCRRTFVNNWRVLHDQSKIGHPYFAGKKDGYPSWYFANTEVLHSPPVGFGLCNQSQVQYFAVAAEKSPDVMVEGHWLVREFDKTWQDNHNGPGEFIYNAYATTVPDDSDLVFAQCGVEKLKLECAHDRETWEGELHVMLGDTVTVTALRVNLAETDPAKRSEIRCDFALYKEKRKPPPEETRHAAFLLSRNAHKAVEHVTEGWEKRENVTLVGDNKKIVDPETKAHVNVTILKLETDWLLKKKTEEEAANDKDAQDDESKRKDDEDKETSEHYDENTDKRREKAKESAGKQLEAQGQVGSAKYEASRNTSPKAKKGVVDAIKKRDAATEQHAKDHAELVRAQKLQAANKRATQAKAVLATWESVQNLFFFQPLEIVVASHGCSKGPSAKIKAFPPGEFSADLTKIKDLPFLVTVNQVQKLVKDIRGFLENIDGLKTVEHGLAKAEQGKADFTVDFYFFRGKKGIDDLEPKLDLVAEWVELERDSKGPHESKGLKKWQIGRKWSVDIGLERLIGLVFKMQVPLLKCSFLAVVTKLLDFFGIKAGPYFEFDINLSLGVGGSFKFDEYGAFEGAEAEIPGEAELGIKLFIQLGELAKVGVEVTGKWTPKYKFAKNDKGQLCLDGEKSYVHVRGKAFVYYDIGIWNDQLEYDLFDWPIEVANTSWALMGDNKP